MIKVIENIASDMTATGRIGRKLLVKIPWEDLNIEDPFPQSELSMTMETTKMDEDESIIDENPSPGINEEYSGPMNQGADLNV